MTVEAVTLRSVAIHSSLRQGLLQPVGGVVALSGAVVQVFDEDRGGEGEHDGNAEEIPGQG